MITHIVLFKFKPSHPDAAAEFQQRLMTLPGIINKIRHFETGQNIVESSRSYDLALYSRFDSLEDLRAYQAHPDHKAVIESFDSAMDSIVAVDYESA
jgi:antibiotic biosynthesis monooxygenase (ABM) superfamily enzyme